MQSFSRVPRLSSLLSLLFLLSVIADAEHNNNNLEMYYLCPLGNQMVDLDRNPETNAWYVAESPSSTTMKAKACWCISYGSIKPHFCPPEYDTCRISGEKKEEVSCLLMQRNDSSIRRTSDWIVPLLGPIILLIYGTIVLAILFSQNGTLARQYVYRNFVVAFKSICGCCNKSDETMTREQLNTKLLELSLECTKRDYPAWTRNLLYEGVARERVLLERQGLPDPFIRPTRLELKTKVFHYDDDDVKEQQQIPRTRNDKKDTAIKSDEENVRMEEIEEILSKHSLSDVESAISKDEYLPNDSKKEGMKTDVSIFSSVIDSDDDSKIMNCAICMEAIENGDRIGNLECNHLFHVSCLKSWLKKKNECPMCLAKNIAMPKA